MRGREKARVNMRLGLVAMGVLALVLGLGLASPAVAKKKSPATTKASTVPLSPGGTATASATCPGKTHVTGGGFTVAPPFVPPLVRSWTTTSNPSGTRTWTASGAAFTSPGISGSFTTLARCESNALGRLAITASSSATLSPGEFRTLTFQCPRNTHVLSGGYSGEGPTALNHANGWRLDILQSQRTGTREWSVSAFDRGTTPPETATATLTGFVVCEVDQKGAPVDQVTATTPIVPNTRATANPICPKKQHVVSSGFVISPLPGGTGSSVPIIAIDQNGPVGNRSWYIGAYPWPTASLPAGESFLATAYCKKDSVATKK